VRIAKKIAMILLGDPPMQRARTCKFGEVRPGEVWQHPGAEEEEREIYLKLEPEGPLVDGWRDRLHWGAISRDAGVSIVLGPGRPGKVVWSTGSATVEVWE